MLTQGIEAERLHKLDIVNISVHRCGQVNSVGIIALVKQSVENIRLTVKAYAVNPVHTPNVHRAYRKIAFNFVIFTL